MFKNISNFYNVNNYLYILNATLIVELCVVYLSTITFIKSVVLKKWYKMFGFSAFIAELFSILIGIISTQFFYGLLFKNFNLILFIILAVIIQMIHDLSIYIFFRMLKKGSNKIVNLFKAYANEMSYNC